MSISIQSLDLVLICFLQAKLSTQVWALEMFLSVCGDTEEVLQSMYSDYMTEMF